MQLKWKSPLVLLAVLACGSGCAHHAKTAKDLAQTGEVQVLMVPVPELDMPTPTITLEKGFLNIAGKVRATGSSAITGRLNVEIYGPTGSKEVLPVCWTPSPVEPGDEGSTYSLSYWDPIKSGSSIHIVYVNADQAAREDMAGDDSGHGGGRGGHGR